ncbi:hypothetical protein RSSM_00683 [Rhodopirellula sallentina SM41]|uniref:Uncharacterized protein n=1 Tax=Rhodopirellula sallentina SM41 TaxID=1263870 RepID=M5U9B2_9BACT|nr:hypothetical protein RSSM_00683 [Rhodopirellula sallentina SM41]
MASKPKSDPHVRIRTLGLSMTLGNPVADASLNVALCTSCDIREWDLKTA